MVVLPALFFTAGHGCIALFNFLFFTKKNNSSLTALRAVGGKSSRQVGRI